MPQRQPRATARTGASPFATSSQRSPPSSDRNTEPSSVPMTTVRPRAARQPVSTLSLNHSGSPIRQRSNGAEPSCGRRYTAARRPWWPPDGAVGGAEQHGAVGHGDGATVMRVESVVVPLPRVTGVVAPAEAVGGGHEDE